MLSRAAARRALLTALALAMLGLGCRRSETAQKDGPEASELCVFAASSLRDTFSELGREFEREHAGVRVVSQVPPGVHWRVGHSDSYVHR